MPELTGYPRRRRGVDAIPKRRSIPRRSRGARQTASSPRRATDYPSRSRGARRTIHVVAAASTRSHDFPRGSTCLERLDGADFSLVLRLDELLLRVRNLGVEVRPRILAARELAYLCGSPRRRGDAPRTSREVKAASASLRDYSSTRRLAMSQSWQTGIFNQRDRSLPVCVGRVTTFGYA